MLRNSFAGESTELENILRSLKPYFVNLKLDIFLFIFCINRKWLLTRSFQVLMMMTFDWNGVWKSCEISFKQMLCWMFMLKGLNFKMGVLTLVYVMLGLLASTAWHIHTYKSFDCWAPNMVKLFLCLFWRNVWLCIIFFKSGISVSVRMYVCKRVALEFVILH